MGSFFCASFHVVGKGKDMATRLSLTFASIFLFAAIGWATTPGPPVVLDTTFGPADENGYRTFHVHARALPGCTELRLRIKGDDGAIPDTEDWHEIPCSGPLATVQLRVLMPPTSLVWVSVDMKTGAKSVGGSVAFRPPDAPPRPEIGPVIWDPARYSHCGDAKPLSIAPNFVNSRDMYASVANGTFHTRLGSVEATAYFWTALAGVGRTTRGVWDTDTFVYAVYCALSPADRDRFLALYDEKLHASMVIHVRYLKYISAAAQ